MVHYARTQLSVYLGLRKHRKKGEEAVTKKLVQLHTWKSFRPIHRDQITEDQNKEALEMLVLLKEKRDGTTKGRVCAEG